MRRNNRKLPIKDLWKEWIAVLFLLLIGFILFLLSARYKDFNSTSFKYYRVESHGFSRRFRNSFSSSW